MESFAPVSFQQFKKDVEERYQALVRDGDWDKPPKDETILALRAEAADLKKKLAKVQKKRKTPIENDKTGNTNNKRLPSWL